MSGRFVPPPLGDEPIVDVASAVRVWKLSPQAIRAWSASGGSIRLIGGPELWFSDLIREAERQAEKGAGG